jgi:hypothetical protein
MVGRICHSVEAGLCFHGPRAENTWVIISLIFFASNCRYHYYRLIDFGVLMKWRNMTPDGFVADMLMPYKMKPRFRLNLSYFHGTAIFIVIMFYQTWQGTARPWQTMGILALQTLNLVLYYYNVLNPEDALVSLNKFVLGDIDKAVRTLSLFTSVLEEDIDRHYKHLLYHNQKLMKVLKKAVPNKKARKERFKAQMIKFSFAAIPDTVPPLVKKPPGIEALTLVGCVLLPFERAHQSVRDALESRFLCLQGEVPGSRVPLTKAAWEVEQDRRNFFWIVSNAAVCFFVLYAFELYAFYTLFSFDKTKSCKSS